MDSKYVKLVGLTKATATLIEQLRTRPDQSEDDIILMALRRSPPPADQSLPYDLGQGVVVYAGEQLVLFLNEQQKRERRPAGTVDVCPDGLYVYGQRVVPSRGSEITPAMQMIQHHVGHRQFGQLISLNAFMKLYVVRGGELIRLNDLKNPALVRRRGRRLNDEQARRLRAPAPRPDAAG
jgi:hypothetical protein